MKDLTRGNELKVIFFFSLPMLIGNVFQQLYNTVDSIVVGNFIGKGALAAVGASFPIIFLLVALVMGITMGSTIIIAQYYGARDMEKVKKAIHTTYIYSFWAGLAGSIIGFVLSRPLLLLLKTPEDIMPQAVIYLHIIFVGMLFSFGYNMISAILRGLGDSKTPLFFLIIATLVNIVLDLLFVVVFHWGVAGAAWATIIAQGVSFFGGMIYLNRKHELFAFKLSDIRFDPEIFKLSIRIGFPSGIQQMLVAAGNMALLRIVNIFGTDTVAAYTAATRIDTFASMPAMNLSQALSTFVGQNLGANKPERVKKGYKTSLFMASAISLTTTLIVVLFGESIMRLFTADLQVIHVGTRYLLIVGSFYIIFSSMFVTNGVLRGAGDTIIPMFVSLLSLWLIRVPVAALLSSRLGSDGIWWSIPVGWSFGFLLALANYLSGRWKRKAVVGNPVD
jgi:putative MATE family efflux protein